MAARTQVRRRESQSPPSRARSADRERTSQDSPLIAPEDLAELGVEQQLIPFVISTASQVDQLPDGATSLSSTDAENLVEILDKVHLPPWFPPCALTPWLSGRFIGYDQPKLEVPVS